MANTDALVWRALHDADVDGAVALDAEAGWNQIAADWRQMLAMGAGTGVVAPDGRLAATSMLLPMEGRFGWIAMILVTGDWQRRGLATELMRRCIAEARQRGLIAGLDATEAGRLVYLPLGFRDIYSLSRWMAERPEVPGSALGVRPVAIDDLGRIGQWEAEIFGADRTDFLRHLWDRCPERAFLAERDGAITGFVLARDGRLATQIGPLSAADRDSAECLLRAALGSAQGPVFLDAADRHGWIAEMLRPAGFERQRGYMRMLLDRDEPLDDPERVYLIAGPEFG
ncbi:MAG: GNAT family N-acetyltransferase [Alphaproteobacteria bacterium]|jgi:GNAT superfamily N-acetyltransferase|nr:GNAT family N-acetyltransferase [Alphaproteobacteria bacterium]MDP6566714.1 GNAT family N-acetyltransferase [Alphaproteobacteria bacterium]MDP6814229.1 GNAT family N-acetyltransferase [Alphaproteobacteria bacterium]